MGMNAYKRTKARHGRTKPAELLAIIEKAPNLRRQAASIYAASRINYRPSQEAAIQAISSHLGYTRSKLIRLCLKMMRAAERREIAELRELEARAKRRAIREAKKGRKYARGEKAKALTRAITILTAEEAYQIEQAKEAEGVTASEAVSRLIKAGLADLEGLIAWTEARAESLRGEKAPEARRHMSHRRIISAERMASAAGRRRTD